MFRGLAAAAAAFVLLLPTCGAAQTPLNADELAQWYTEIHHAAQLYAAADTTGALALLLKRNVPLEQQRALARDVIADVEFGRLAAGRRPWTMPLLRALAALYMEAAIEDYVSGTSGAISDHVSLAETLFAYARRVERGPDAAPIWELALGLAAAADGRVGWAATILDRACKRYPDDAPLLLACGSVHEAAAMLPAHAFVEPAPARASSGIAGTDVSVSAPTQASGGGGSFESAVDAARAERARHLEFAGKLLERVVRIDSSNIEALIRLAHVRTMKGQDKDAARLLEKVLSGTLKTDSRGVYLAALFLGTIQLRAKQPDRAAALFRTASDAVPTAQTALIALAFAAHAAGDDPGSAALLERSLQQSIAEADPWWGYRLAQYWLVKPLLADLRKRR